MGKSCSFCLPRVPFVNCRQFMYLVISLLVLRAGYGIWLYQFLIIAYLFTLSVSNRQWNRQPATSCQLPIRWTYIVRFESESATGNYLPVADSLNLSVLIRQPATSCQFADLLNLYCLFRILICNRQIVAGCRFVELLCLESATEFVELVCIESAIESATGS